jgi:hypothetical protein
MRFGRRRALIGFLACVTACAPTTHDVAVDRYDVGLTLHADGSVDVHEQIQVRALAARAAFVRDFRGQDVDRVVDVVSDGDVEDRRQESFRVVWPLSPSGAGALNLKYRLAGALGARQTRGILRWAVLPTDRSYPVGASRINISSPAGSAFVVGPQIDDGGTPWVVAGTDARVELSAVAPVTPVILTAEVDFGSRPMPEPAWQTNATRAWHLMPAFVSAGLCLIGIALGILVMIRLQYGAGRSRFTRDARRTGDAATAGRELEAVSRGLRVTGFVSIAMALGSAIAIDRTLARFDIWPMAIPVGLFLMGAVFVWEARRLRQYTSRL